MPKSLVYLYLTLNVSSQVSGPMTSRDIMTKVVDKLPMAAHDDRFEVAAIEVARARGGELHATSAVTGGLVAQEIIKLVTKQYIPIDNVCVYNGIEARCQVFRI